ncbi:MAG: acyltransferase [Hahellaceae bacterium]|nr:acyltransferase [Hahellaceae bacterium]
MLNFLPAPLIGVISALLLGINTVFWCTLLYIPAILKLIIPHKGWRVLCTKVIIWISECWIAFNSGWMKLTQKTRWDVEGLDNLNHEGWYLVLSNHQSWVDIFALQHVLNRKVPFLKFFLKQELIWVPVIGLAWWGLDFPFMKRHSPEYLKKNPHMRGKDLETTRKACEKFRYTPVSVMNFVEGTRFTPAKHERQASPYQHLLKPRPGGTAFVLDTMGDYIHTLLNITLVYPYGRPTFKDFICGRVKEVRMRVEQVQIPAHLLNGNYAEDAEHRENFKQWLHELWLEKDKKIADMSRA